MEWILDNLQLVIVVVIIASYVLRGLKQKPPEEDEATGPSPETGDADDAERTRRIQEEIRRRILERQRGPSVDAPRPVVIFDSEPERPTVIVPPPMPPPMQEVYAVDAAHEEALARQSRMLEQMSELKRTRAATAAAASTIRRGSVSQGACDTRGLRSALRRDLAGQPGLRRAVLLKEILGEPPGLRSGSVGVPRK